MTKDERDLDQHYGRTPRRRLFANSTQKRPVPRSGVLRSIAAPDRVAEIYCGTANQRLAGVVHPRGPAPLWRLTLAAEALRAAEPLERPADPGRSAFWSPTVAFDCPCGRRHTLDLERIRAEASKAPPHRRSDRARRINVAGVLSAQTRQKHADDGLGVSESMPGKDFDVDEWLSDDED